MSVIGKKPFINKIIDACSKEQTQQIIDLMDRLDIETPIPVSLYGSDNLISSENIGVSYVTLAMNELTRQILTGILVYVNDNKCGFFGVINNSDIIDEFEIDPINKTYNKIREYLTIEELRQVCGDRVSEINDMDVAGSQATTTIIRDALTNINGRVLSSYEATLHEGGGGTDYTYYKITKGGNDLTEEEAADYMEYMTGSRFVPTYKYEKPQNSLFVMADGSIWKPQWMASGDYKGMILFFVSDGSGGGLPEATKAGQVLVSNEDLQFEERDAVPMAENLTATPISNDSLYVDGPTGGLADITTGEESYLQEIKGYSLVWWVRKLSGSGSVSLNNKHTYLALGRNGAYEIKRNATTYYYAVNILFDLTSMFGADKNIPFSLDTYEEYPTNGTIPAQTYKPNYGFQRLLGLERLGEIPEDRTNFYIKNVKATKLVETGQNLWDASTMEETGLLLLAGYRYEIYLTGSSTSKSISYQYWYSSNQMLWSQQELTRYQRADGKYVWIFQPNENVYIKSYSGSQIVYVGFVHSGNYCLTTGTINNASKAATDMPIPSYQKHEYDISGINGLNGIPDDSNNHCSVYDTKDIRRVGVIEDLSTLDWTIEGNNKSAVISGIKPSTTHIFAAQCVTENSSGVVMSVDENGILTIQGWDSPTGKFLFELETPEETGEAPFEPIRIEVNDMGEEYFIQPEDTNCPVNQISLYYTNLKDKLVNLKIPDVPAAVMPIDYNIENTVLNGLKIGSLYYKITPLGSFQTNSGALAIGSGSSASSYSLVVGNSSLANYTYSTIIGLGGRSLGGQYGIAIGYSAYNTLPKTVSFDSTLADAQIALNIFDTTKIFFRNEVPNASKNTFAKYTKGHYLDEYICNNTLTLQDGKYYVSYTDASNYKTFTSNVISGTATDITSTITGVHITVVLTDNDTTPTWHSVVGMDLMLYDSTNSLPYNSYARIDCGGTVEDIIAYIDADGCVVITAPTGTVISSVKYNIK